MPRVDFGLMDEEGAKEVVREGLGSLSDGNAVDLILDWVRSKDLKSGWADELLIELNTIVSGEED